MMKILEKTITKKIAEKMYSTFKNDNSISNEWRPGKLNFGFSFSMFDDIIPSPVSIKSLGKYAVPFSMDYKIDSPVHRPQTITE